MSENKVQKLSIIGGGITGLTAAYEALKRGETDVHVYEASGRFGGKIQSGRVNGQIINRGAEFIDSDHEKLIALANELGVPLVENKGMEREEFIGKDGKVMTGDKFYAAYLPFALAVTRDREQMKNNPSGARAQMISAMTLDQYVSALQQEVKPQRNFWQMITDTFGFTHRGDMMDVAANCYASEAGQPINKVSAAQFVTETSETNDAFLASDCKYRVKGGTEALIVRLRETLAARGVQFHTGAELESIGKNLDGMQQLHFKDGKLNTKTGKTIFALPTYSLSKVKGLDSIGLSQQARATLADAQYTNSYKLTIAFKPGMQPPEGAYFTPNGFQCWSPAPGLFTILSTAEGLNGKSPKQLIHEQLQNYAKAHGSTADAMFDTKNMDFNYPGKAACYASPRPGQKQAMQALIAEMPALAKNGIGIAGTYLPHEDYIGFMENGVVSAQRSCDLLIGPTKEVDAPAQQRAYHLNMLQARRAGAAAQSTGAQLGM